MRRFHKQFRVDLLTIKAAMFVGKVHNLEEVLRGIKGWEESSIQKKIYQKSTVMQNLVYACVGVCVLVAVSTAGRPGGRPGGNLEQYQICQDLVAQQNETLQLLQEFPCFDNVSFAIQSII